MVAVVSLVFGQCCADVEQKQIQLENSWFPHEFGVQRRGQDMTGIGFGTAKGWPMRLALVAAMGLVACDENGEFGFPSAGAGATEDGVPAANAPNQSLQAGQDIERPDIFEVTDRGLWDGRPSLGGVWVAHPDAQDPERVVIRNTENGRSIVGALFRRERENPGPLLQISSDAADELGILPGAPTQLSVVALRRDETVVAEPSEAELNPVVASLEAPVSVAASPLEAVETDEASGETEDTAVAPVAVVLPPALEAATEQTSETADAVTDAVDVSAVLAAPVTAPTGPKPLPPGSTAQVGVFSVEDNAGAAAPAIIAAGLRANVFAQEVGGRTVWRVVAGPLADTGAIEQLKALGFADTYLTELDALEDETEAPAEE